MTPSAIDELWVTATEQQELGTVADLLGVSRPDVLEDLIAKN